MNKYKNAYLISGLMLVFWYPQKMLSSWQDSRGADKYIILFSCETHGGAQS